jgi:hypothetical protein
MLSVIYAECRKLAYYDECLYAECRGASICPFISYEEETFFEYGPRLFEPKINLISC